MPLAVALVLGAIVLILCAVLAWRIPLALTSSNAAVELKSSRRLDAQRHARRAVAAAVTHALAGATLFAVVSAAVVVQLATSRWPLRPLLATGMAAMLVGLAVTVTAVCLSASSFDPFHHRRRDLQARSGRS